MISQGNSRIKDRALGHVESRLSVGYVKSRSFNFISFLNNKIIVGIKQNVKSLHMHG